MTKLPMGGQQPPFEIMRDPKPKPFRWGSHFKNGKLYVFDKHAVLVARPWPELRAWRLAAENRLWRPVRPEIDVQRASVSPDGTPRRAFASIDWMVDELPPLGDAPPGPKGDADDKALHDWIERKLNSNRLACEQFFSLMPEHIRAMLQVFTSRQWHVAVLLARCPGAEDLLQSTPALAFALASNWAFHRPPVRQPIRAARSWVHRRQRDLAGWLGFPATEASVRLLRKIPPAACHVTSLLYLRSAMWNPDMREHLSHVRQFDATTQRLLCDERLHLRTSPKFIREVAGTASGVGSCSRYLRSIRDVLEMEALMPAANRPSFHSIRQLVQYHDTLVTQLNSAEVSHFQGLQFPPPPLPGTDEILPLCSPAALHIEGREQSNCVSSYAPRIMRGGQFVYRVLAPERATLLIVRRKNSWQLGELAGPYNQSVRLSTRRAVERWLDDCTTEKADPF